MTAGCGSSWTPPRRPVPASAAGRHALSSRFELAPDEAAFAGRHRGYDRWYTLTHLVNWLAVALHGYGPEERRAYVDACARGVPPGDMPPAIAALLVRHASVAAVMGDFTHRFRRESRTTAFPLEAIRRIERRDDPPGAPAGGTPRGDGPRPAAPRT
ncbi:hypothetical protein [Streptomyces capillispiralis]|uniref:Uncharacterized protein n=1 Tax=Streptomyces capillispiralis TaxID=68182 RepID=A0A561TRW7_9ACTN|nr:hypothetical protein [Streptomyces capillispiralis]TWF89852.1 hypothetical protein FHX78_116899 [Streptomyces capillispiralis]GHH95674.1 hypothetical protein GCM10017779_61310 [Streptomyces capillispiralis]